MQWFPREIFFQWGGEDFICNILIIQHSQLQHCTFSLKFYENSTAFLPYFKLIFVISMVLWQMVGGIKLYQFTRFFLSGISLSHGQGFFFNALNSIVFSLFTYMPDLRCGPSFCCYRSCPPLMSELPLSSLISNI